MPEPSGIAESRQVARIHPCPICGPVEWTIIRDVDHLAAECPNHRRCGVSFDIGWSTNGYR